MNSCNIVLIILLGVVIPTWQMEHTYLLKDAGRIVFFENEKTMKYEIDLRNYYKNAELLSQPATAGASDESTPVLRVQLAYIYTKFGSFSRSVHLT